MSEFVRIKASKLSLVGRKKVCGVGINDAPYSVTYMDEFGAMSICPIYDKWLGMINRCYSGKNRNYDDCTVVKDWHLFSNFARWMEPQEYIGLCLDKDIMVPGNKLYSPDTCVFVNKLLNLQFKSRLSNLPRGVIWQPKRQKFLVSGSGEHLGRFTNLEDATKVANNHRAEVISTIAEETTDLRLKQALLNHVKELLGEVL